jgi:hypothetical protein
MGHFHIGRAPAPATPSAPVAAPSPYIDCIFLSEGGTVLGPGATVADASGDTLNAPDVKALVAAAAAAELAVGAANPPVDVVVVVVFGLVLVGFDVIASDDGSLVRPDIDALGALLPPPATPILELRRIPFFGLLPVGYALLPLPGESRPIPAKDMRECDADVLPTPT